MMKFDRINNAVIDQLATCLGFYDDVTLEYDSPLAWARAHNNGPWTVEWSGAMGSIVRTEGVFIHDDALPGFVAEALRRAGRAGEANGINASGR